MIQIIQRSGKAALHVLLICAALPAAGAHAGEVCFGYENTNFQNADCRIVRKNASADGGQTTYGVWYVLVGRDQNGEDVVASTCDGPNASERDFLVSKAEMLKDAREKGYCK